MSKYHGSVGYLKTLETSSGVYEEKITERQYYGDVMRLSRNWQTGQSINDDVAFNNQISIIADPYAYENLGYIRYVVWMNTKWKVTSVEVQYPRIILTIGGIYNGPTDDEET